ncbi:MAG: type II secretion system F family protein [Myxococcales bacterium]|nr:type II secretion system F family protein [Myxococcales bacterium]
MTGQHLLLLKVLVFASVLVALGTLVYAALVAPRGDGKRLGLRGLKRRRALETNETWRTLEPLVRWIGQRVDGFISDGYRAKLNYQIGVAGDFMGLLPEELVGLSVLAALVGLPAGWALGAYTGMGHMLTMGCCVFGAVAPTMVVSSTANDRFREVNRRLPYAIDLLALGMGAGLDFPGAVRQVVEKSGTPTDPIVEEFALIMQGFQLGRTRRQALEEFAARVPSDAVKEFVGAVVQAELRGNPVANVLRIQAEVSRQRRSVRAEESASKAGVAMVAPLMLVFLTILMLIVAPMIFRIQAGG